MAFGRNQFMFSILLASLLSFVAAQDNVPGTPSIGCITAHCGGKLFSCQFNKECKETLSCSQACNNNLICSEKCVTRYGNSKFDDLTVCIQSNSCVTPYPKLDFTTPTPISTSLQQVVGKYYVKGGLDPGLDCYDYATIDIKSVGDAIHHDLTIKFPEGPRTISTILKNPTSPATNSGAFELVYTLAGGGTNKWYVVGQSTDLLVIVYTGGNALSNYRGSYILSKTPQDLTADQLQSVKEMLAHADSTLKVEEYCLNLKQ